MQRGQQPTLIDGKLPVFVFPTSLTFYSDDQSSHKQVLTLYNPYDFTLKFKVLCTGPRKYTVVDAEGSIKSRCCVDIVIRHKDITINNEGIRDKFRIHVSEVGQKAIIGKKDVLSVLLPTKDKAGGVEDKFESLPLVAGLQRKDSQSSTQSRAFHRGGQGGPGWVVIMATVVCIAALMLPSVGEADSRLPSYLLLTLNQKLIAAYILGLVTMVVMRS